MADSPNLLFIYTDEQRFDTLAAYGNRLIAMPNLDRLAGRSCVFERAYVTQPVCTPSRSSILTGLYPHTNGCTTNNLPLSEEVPCLPEMLPAGRYASGHFGKWHLGDELYAQHGFEHWVSIEDQYNRWFRPGRDREKVSDYSRWLRQRGRCPADGRAFGRLEAARLPEVESKPAFLAESAAGFIREHRDRPFCLFVNFLEPHMPFTGPRDNQYDPAGIPLPGNYHCRPGPGHHLRNRMLHAGYRSGRKFDTPVGDPAAVRRLLARYYGLCSQVDTWCGAILDVLDECALRDNTIIVFTSDHGDMMGAHQLIAKTVMYEEAVRVPLLVSLPGQREALSVPGPVSQADLVPTLLELMGVTPPGHLEGRSLAGALAGAPEKAAGDVVIEWNGANSGLGGDDPARVELPGEVAALASREELVAALRDPVRTIISADGRWKFCVSPLGMHELYDLDADPLECENIFGQPGLEKVTGSLLERLRRWQSRTGDRVKLPGRPEGK